VNETRTALNWAREEFGSAKLGNALRTRRLVRMAARMADSPSGLVTGVFRTVAERVGAYRWLENDRISLKQVIASSAQASIGRAAGASWMFVPVDGSSLTMADPSGRRKLGSVGSYRQRGRGLKTMTSIGVDLDGTPLGLLDLQWWVRQEVPGRKQRRDRRPLEDKETRYWLQSVQAVEAATGQGGVRSWFQLDREGDFHGMLRWMDETTISRATVRAAANRRTATGEARYLWDALLDRAAGGSYGLDVAAGPKRPARRAHMVVRWAPVRLALRDRRSGSGARRTPVDLWAVLALETGTVPPGEKPIQWLLLTNAPVTDFYAAVEVLFGYAQRWRIEEFHRAWKTECGVEHSQLHDVPHIQLWATLLAAVAMRIERLKYLARHQPDIPASVEFSRDEIDAVIVLRQPPGYHRGDTPTIAQTVRWVADLGGYIDPMVHRAQPSSLAAFNPSRSLLSPWLTLLCFPSPSRKPD